MNEATVDRLLEKLESHTGVQIVKNVFLDALLDVETPVITFAELPITGQTFTDESGITTSISLTRIFSNKLYQTPIDFRLSSIDILYRLSGRMSPAMLMQSIHDYPLVADIISRSSAYSALGFMQTEKNGSDGLLYLKRNPILVTPGTSDIGEGVIYGWEDSHAFYGVKTVNFFGRPTHKPVTQQTYLTKT